jgi:hypothetical protein
VERAHEHPLTKVEEHDRVTFAFPLPDMPQQAAVVKQRPACRPNHHEGISEIARVAYVADDRMENIGARRLHTVTAALMEDVLFELPLSRILNDDDLRRYIL